MPTTIDPTENIRTWLAAILNVPAYSYVAEDVKIDTPSLVWMNPDGEDREDCLDDDSSTPADFYYFNVEIYGETRKLIKDLQNLLRDQNDEGGKLGNNFGCQSIWVEDFEGDYEPIAEAADLPKYVSVLRLTIVGYEEF